MRAKEFKSFVVLAITFIVLGAGQAFPYDTPDPDRTFYADASGDQRYLSDDYLVHRMQVYFSSGAYDTPQPKNADQRWNTCDVNGDRDCLGDELIELKGLAYGTPLSKNWDSWNIVNVDLPAATSVGVHSSFQLGVVANDGADNARPGIVVKITVPPDSPVQDVVLTGRPCPIPDTKCAVSVGITDWSESTSVAPTETDENGFGFTANERGTLTLLAEFNAFPDMHIDATSARFDMDIDGPESVSIDCSTPGPNPVDEYGLIQCALTDEGGTVQVDSANDTCDGSIVGSNYEYTPSDLMGGGNCVAAVELDSNTSVKDQDTIYITEVNVPPVNNAPSAASGEILELISFDMAPTDLDIPVQSLTCSIVYNGCSGGYLNGCVFEWTPTEADGPDECDVVTVVNDGDEDGNQVTTTVTVIDPPNPPYLTNLPATESGHWGQADSYLVTAIDNDLPAQPLTFSNAGDTCSFGVNVAADGTAGWTCGAAVETCSVDVQVCDSWLPPMCDTEALTIECMNTAPVITSAASTMVDAGTIYSYDINCTDADSDTLAISAGASDTCLGTYNGSLTDNGNGTAVYTFAPGNDAGPTTCELSIECTDTVSTDVQGPTTINIDSYCCGADWISMSTSTASPLFYDHVTPANDVARVAENYPAGFNQLVLNFDTPITACDVQVDCETSGVVAETATAGGNDCIVTASAGHWPSGETCDVTIISTTPSCLGLYCDNLDTVKFSLLESECSPLGGTCGGFIDDGTWGTDNYNVQVDLVDADTYEPITPTNSGHAYVLLEQDYNLAPSSVRRAEAFDGDNDGTVAVAAMESGPAKITASYKGGADGECGRNMWPSLRDCYQYATFLDVDARRVVLPLELTTTESMWIPRRFLFGDFTIDSWNVYVGGAPAQNNLPQPLRFGLAMPVFANKSPMELEMEDIFQPDGDGRTIQICYGDAGMYDISIGAELPYNIALPDIIRDDWTRGCDNGYLSGPDTSWRHYTSARGTTLTMMTMVGYINDSQFIFKAPDISSLPAFVKAMGTYNATIPESYDDESFYNMGNTPANMDMRDPDFPAGFDTNTHTEGGNAAGVGLTTLGVIGNVNLPDDPARVGIGAGASPPYGDPNAWERANWGWGGEDVRNGIMMILGGRIPAASATDPGGNALMQVHMTSKVDDSRFTVFQRACMTDYQNPPFFSIEDSNPWSGSSTNTGNVSRRLTGFPNTVTDPGGELDWTGIEMAVNFSMRRPPVQRAIAGIANVPDHMPGAIGRNVVLGSVSDGSVTPVTEFLGRGDVTDPSHDGYHVPDQTDSNGSPINRNGQIWRGTARIGVDVIGEKADAVKYLTLNNPTLNTDSTRRPDFFVMYLSDPVNTPWDVDGGLIDWRGHNEGKPYKDRFWKFVGDLHGLNGAESYEFTVPWIAVGNRAINGVTAQVPRPFQGAYSYFTVANNTRVEWELIDVIIGTDLSEGALTAVFDYQNQDFGWCSNGVEYRSMENHQFIWIQ